MEREKAKKNRLDIENRLVEINKLHKEKDKLNKHQKIVYDDNNRMKKQRRIQYNESVKADNDRLDEYDLINPFGY